MANDSIYIIPKSAPCPSCGDELAIDWAGLAMRHVEVTTASMKCPKCGAVHRIIDWLGKRVGRIDNVG